eukprot:gene23872-28912_t
MQFFCNRADRPKLDAHGIADKDPDLHIITIPGNISQASHGQPYKVFAIYSEPKDKKSNYPPVCIPNGLGATAVLISQMQERLV